MTNLSGVFERLVPMISDHYGSRSYDEFYRRLELAQNHRFLHLPLLSDPTAKRIAMSSLTQGSSRLSSLKLTNISERAAEIEVKANFSKPTSVHSLFHDFTQIAHHYVRLQHFRDFPEYYSRVLAGNDYFVFHGDGFCCQLAVLFQALARACCDETVKAMYTRTDDFMFSHGYCLYDGADGLHYFDPDLKAEFPYSEIRAFEPSTWFVNFLENIAIFSFHNLDKEQQRRLFYSFTREYFDWLGESCTRELSQKNSRYDVTLNLFRDTLPTRNEEYDIESDDYPWKKKFRECALRQGAEEGRYFFQSLHEPAILHLEPGDTFCVNPANLLAREEVQLLQGLFFGRVPGVIEFSLAAGESRDVLIPEIPWGIAFSNSSHSININEEEVAAHPLLSAASSFLGMGDIESAVGGYEQARRFTLSAGESTKVQVVLPLNASFWNSELSQLSFSQNNFQCEVYES